MRRATGRRPALGGVDPDARAYLAVDAEARAYASELVTLGELAALLDDDRGLVGYVLTREPRADEGALDFRAAKTAGLIRPLGPISPRTADGLALRRRRLALGLSIERLSALSGVSQGSVSHLERGLHGQRSRARIVAALECLERGIGGGLRATDPGGPEHIGGISSPRAGQSGGIRPPSTGG